MDSTDVRHREGQPPLLNIANVLTVIRILVVPVFLVVFFHGGGHDTVWRIAAFVVFALAMYTDKLDGDLARSRGLITDFGKIADPIADKAQMGAALIALSVVGDLWWWVTIVILAREIGITLWRLAIIKDRVVPASRGGKLKTVTQTVAMAMFILPLPHVFWPVSWAVMGAALVLTVWTGIDYIVKAHAAGPGRA